MKGLEIYATKGFFTDVFIVEVKNVLATGGKIFHNGYLISNTLFEGACVRLNYLRNYDRTPVMEMKDS